MKRFILLSLIVCLGLVAYAQSPLKTVSFHKNPNEIVDLRELKEKSGHDSDLDGNKAARIRIKAQGFDEKKMLDFTVFPRPGMEVIYKEFQQGEMWVYVSSKVQGTLVIKYMGEFEFKLPYKLEPKCGYDLVLGMETATLVIRATPENSDIYIDNEKVGTGYASKTVSIGMEHRWKVQCPDYFPKEGVKLFSSRSEESIDVELDPNFGYLTVVSDPAGAELYIDGKKVGTTPYMYERISRGQHRVEVKKDRYNPYVNVVNVKIGETIQLNDVKLTAIRVPMGSMELTSNPTGAVITINGRQYGQTPKTLTDLEVGTYTVYFSKEGYQNLSQTVEVKDGKKETLAVTMTKASVPRQPVPTTPVATSGSINGTSTTTASGNKIFTVNGVSFEMVAIKGGTFTMGSTDEYAKDDEKPTHDVTLTDYYIGKYEVTQKLWIAVMGNNPSFCKGDDLPVEQVSWIDAQVFLRELNKLTGQNFRLPTEAEWEYAARGGTQTSLYNGNIVIEGKCNSYNLDKIAWYSGNCGRNYTADAGCDMSNYYKISGWEEKQYPDTIGASHPVGMKQPNAYGIYDMLGNVCEWCQDWYVGGYDKGSFTNPTGPDRGFVRVFRGGCWNYEAKYCRVTSRAYYVPAYKYDNIGFRIVLSNTTDNRKFDLKNPLKMDTPDCRTYNVNGAILEMVPVTGGTFTMGATSEQGEDCKDDEKPIHKVVIDDFYIGKYEVTQQLWEAVMGITIFQQRDKANMSWPIRGEGRYYPMYYVSWEDCQEFIIRLNQITGLNFRLPTEAEWEYAARGGRKSNGYKYSGDSSLDYNAWFNGISMGNTVAVGTVIPNELGIFDMSGNVCEWCQDWYGYYGDSSQNNPNGPGSGSKRVIRGGSWNSSYLRCRVSCRGAEGPEKRYDDVGFRLVLAP